MKGCLGLRPNGERINGSFHLLKNGTYWDYNPLVLTFYHNFQRDVQVEACVCAAKHLSKNAKKKQNFSGIFLLFITSLGHIKDDFECIMDFPTNNHQVVERLPKCTLCQIKFGAAKIIHSSNPWGSNHLLRMVMQPEYFAEEVIVHPSWIPREWIFRQKLTKWQLSKFQFKHCAEVTTTTWTRPRFHWGFLALHTLVVGFNPSEKY